MPVSVRNSPFNDDNNRVITEPIIKRGTLRAPQARVLAALMPEDTTSPPLEWPLFNRITMRERCGMSPTNSMNRILHGVKKGTDAHLGLIELGFVEEIPLNIDGVIEYNYRITPHGAVCLFQYGLEGHK